jgi:hypothetical protein
VEDISIIARFGHGLQSVTHSVNAMSSSGPKADGKQERCGNMAGSRVAQRGGEAAGSRPPDDANLQSICNLDVSMSAGPGSPLSLSVFFPAFNDAESLRVLIPKSIGILQTFTTDFEVIVVDDGSTDHTPRVLQELQGQFPSLQVIRHEQNRGYGAALRSGFQASSKSLVFYTDGDGQYDVAELRDLVARLRDGVDVVNGYKLQRADSLHRRLLGRFYHRLVRLLFGTQLRDIDCDFRLLRRQVLDSVLLSFSSGAICVELMTQIERAGYRIEEVPVHHYPRMSGKSQFFHVVPVVRMARDVGRLWVRLVLLRRGPNAARAQRVPAPTVESTDPRVSG